MITADQVRAEFNANNHRAGDLSAAFSLWTELNAVDPETAEELDKEFREANLRMIFESAESAAELTEISIALGQFAEDYGDDIPLRLHAEFQRRIDAGEKANIGISPQPVDLDALYRELDAMLSAPAQLDA